MYRKAIAFTTLILLPALSVAANPLLVGQWRFTSDIAGSLKERSCQFEQRAGAFNGVCRDDTGSVRVTGSVEASNVVFSYDADAYGQMMRVTCAGQFRDEAVTGTLSLGPLIGSCNLMQTSTIRISAGADRKCRKYLGRTFDGATVTRAQVSPATDIAPETCVVRGEMPQDLDFEIRMPTRWNGRTVFIGGGGFDGSIGKRFISAAATKSGLPGYATISTNHGHNENVTPGATFASSTQMLSEYAYLSVPRVLAPAKSILREQYGKPFDTGKMVFEGCSGGGRQALVQAQRYPDLFDGIVARAPATSYVPQFLWYAKLAKMRAAPGGMLSPRKVEAIGSAVRAKCDTLDGLEDGIISRPDACNFDPAELACVSEENDSCLTPAQVATARAYYEPTSVGNGQFAWPGFMPGGESPTAWFNFHGPGFEGFMRYFVAQDPKAEPLSVDPEKYLSRLDYLSRSIDADDPDLNRFKAHGGKLILWTGQADWLITANNATAYYKNVVDAMGGQSATDDFFEYYVSPDVQHCGGGAGPDQVDLVTPMFEWLEKGTKPSSRTIVATKSAPTSKPMSRPLCRFPRYPRYQGGDASSAASFTCALSDDISK